MDLRNPPRQREPWAELYARRLERVARAEDQGFESFWVSEHHMWEDGYCPQPLTFLAAAAARTSRIRLGTSILLAGLRPALQIAEEAAVVDILSAGRLELGLGAGYQKREFDAYGSDIGERYPLLEARTTEIRELWEGGVCMPPPVQERPPIWLGAMGPRGARMAGRLGEGLMWLDPELVAPYRKGLAEGGFDPEADARVCGLVFLVLADDPEEAFARIAPHLAYQRETYNRYASAAENDRQGGPELAGPTVDPDAGEVDPEQLRDRTEVGIPMSPRLRVMRPEGAAQMLRDAFAGMPVTRIWCWDSIAGMPEDLADRHLELMAEYLIPGLADA
jgi:alkanesulfonate monooxygenase SsuD/methylene tetrahydromethanopterin reductase-like flavin-dependent oxidoreductase (luciferase family)